MENDIEKWVDRHPETNLTPYVNNSPAMIMQMALNKGVDVDKLEKLLELQEKWESNEAKKAFFEAKAAFKAIAPPVKKDKWNNQFQSWYTSLGLLLETYNPVLGQFGLSVSFPVSTQTDKAMTSECRLSHAMGHSESISMTVPIDQSAIGKESGKRSRNAIQDIRSTFTYVRAMTCEAVLGVAGTEGTVDDDGNSAQSNNFITESQAKEIEKIIKDKNIDKSVFLTWAKSDAVKNIPISNYGICIARLNESKGRPKTVPCPDKDGRDVEVSACDKCKARKGCPSWV